MHVYDIDCRFVVSCVRLINIIAIIIIIIFIIIIIITITITINCV